MGHGQNCHNSKSTVPTTLPTTEKKNHRTVRPWTFFVFERLFLTYGVHSWWLFFIIKSKHQLVFSISGDWISYLLFDNKKFYQLSWLELTLDPNKTQSQLLPSLWSSHCDRLSQDCLLALSKAPLWFTTGPCVLLLKNSQLLTPCCNVPLLKPCQEIASLTNQLLSCCVAIVEASLNFWIPSTFWPFKIPFKPNCALDPASF